MPINYTGLSGNSHTYNNTNGSIKNQWDPNDIGKDHQLMLSNTAMANLFATIDPGGSGVVKVDYEGLMNLIGTTSLGDLDSLEKIEKEAAKVEKQLKAVAEAKKELEQIKADKEAVQKQITDKKAAMASATGGEKSKLQAEVKALEAKLAKLTSASNFTTKTIKALLAKQKTLRAAHAKQEKAAMEKAKAAGLLKADGTVDTTKPKGADLQKQLDAVKAQMQGMNSAAALARKAMKGAAGTTGDAGSLMGGKAAQAASKPGGSAAAATPQPQAGKAASGGDGGGISFNSGPGAASVGGAQDPTSWYNNLSMAHDGKMAAFDDVMKVQGQSNKMMMLLLYLSRMAMSGDIGAMYRFMQFVASIINRDKAAQNVQLADKLIKLQAVSRALTQELVDTPSYDKNDPQVAADFQKTMETIKADQGMIATEQKLIASMLEEMAQISEMMWNLQKGLLDVNGNIMKNTRFG